MSKIKDYITYRKNLRTVKKNIVKIVNLASDILPSVTELLDEISKNKERLSEISSYILSLSREDIEHIITSAVVDTNSDLKDKE